MPLTRKCGECKACCGPAMGIDDPDLKKPIGESCPKLCASGCSIYDARPKTCRDYSCAWIQEVEGLHVNARPDKSGLLISGIISRFGFAWRIQELWKDARLSNQSQSIIEKLSETYLCFVLRTDGTRTASGPDNDVLTLIASLRTGMIEK